MQFDIITIFPKIMDSYFNESILKRAQEFKKINIKIHNLRDYTADKHHKIDDTPYGGGPGMVFMIEPLYKCLKAISAKGAGWPAWLGSASGRKRSKKSKIILLDPAGKQFDQKMAAIYAKTLDQIIFICGRYEGVDARIDNLINGKISIGPYVLSGGELGAAVIIEAVSRLLPGVLGKFESTEYETFSGKNSEIIEHPHYTKPADFIPPFAKSGVKGWKVPKVLLSGNHQEIAKWRQTKKK